MSLIRHEAIYQAIKKEHEEHNYPVQALCKVGHGVQSRLLQMAKSGNTGK